MSTSANRLSLGVDLGKGASFPRVGVEPHVVSVRKGAAMDLVRHVNVAELNPVSPMANRVILLPSLEGDYGWRRR